MPAADPLKSHTLRGAKVPKAISAKWPMATEEMLSASADFLSSLAIDHEVGPAAFPGGHRHAEKQAHAFVQEGLDRYASDRNHPDLDGGSGLSPYLHFGHISTHQIFGWLKKREDWSRNHLSAKATGSREGWWGMSEAAESFLDEIVTWREVSYNTARHLPNFADYESLPDWSRATLEEHRSDPRENIYTREQLARGETYDPVWNAAQLQLAREGRLHNYMRMLWGKRIIEWAKTPKEALQHIVYLNNKYGVDGRDPNSFSGIFWCFGRYDRPWPTHPIFGKVRMMSSASTKRKLKLKKYLATYA